MTVVQDDRPYWIGVHQIIGNDFYHYVDDLLDFYSSFKNLWLAKDKIPITAIPEGIRQKLLIGRKTIEPLRLWQECIDKGVNVLTCREPCYSKELLQISGYPCILYYYGDLSLLNMPTVAIVGSRQGSAYGLMQSRFFAKTIASQNVCVVSGMAAGIDGAAHEGALEARGKTIAVLGTGLDVVYPREHQKLYRHLCSEALVISEFPLGSMPRPWQFPQRNRIISGLSQVVLVIEAKAKSGALITCDQALEQGKEVCALPGPVTNPGSIGPLRLIQQGAKLVITPQDVLVELETRISRSNLAATQSFGILKDKPVQLSFSQQEPPNKLESNILALLSYEPTHIDELLARLDLNAGMIYVQLNRLKSKGLIDALPGNYYLRI